MKKLIHGIAEFRRGLTDESRALFARLALGVSPDALFIACSDSRVVPNLFASTNPGDLFVFRNVGNLIPPCKEPLSEMSAAAAIEFSVTTLGVADIIVCGHSECAAMIALSGETLPCSCSHLRSWLSYGKSARELLDDEVRCHRQLLIDPALSRHNQLSQVNVIQQMEHLLSYPCVQERVQAKCLRLHGWWFDISLADVYCYEAALKRFVLIDDKEAEAIVKRLEAL